MTNAGSERLAFKYDSETLEDFIDRYAVDITRNGFFIRTKDLLSVGQPVEFELQLHDGSKLLSGVGTVAWVKQPSDESGTTSGMGVRFDRLPLASRKTLDVILRPREAADAQRERASGSYPVIEGEVTKQRKGDSLAEVTIDTEALRAARSRPGTGPYLPLPAEGDSGEQRPAWMGEEEEETSSAWVTWVVLAIIAVVGVWLYVTIYNSADATPPQSSAAEPPPAAAPAPAEPAPPAVPPAAPKTAPTTKVAPGPKASPADAPVRAISWLIQSKPSGARILIDGRDTGKVTPMGIAGLDPRFEVDVTLDLPGKQLHQLRAKPSSKSLMVRLLPAERTINFVSDPPGAKVFINARQVGVTPHSIKANKLRRGHFWLKLELDGYRRLEKKIEPEKLKWVRAGGGEATAVRGQLTKLP